MYVKWVVRRHKNGELANIVFYDAYLVQSYKNEAAEPRQRTLAYLGNLRMIDNQFPVIERALFYLRMEDTMMRNLPPELLTDEEREKLYAGLATVAPAPTESEIKQSWSLNQQWHDGYWRARAARPATLSSGFAQIVDENGNALSPMELDIPLEVAEQPVSIIGSLSPKIKKLGDM